MRLRDKEPLSRGLLLSLILLLSAAAAPHFLHLHSWITILFLASVAWRIACIARPALLPGRLLLLVLAILGLADVAVNYPILFSGDTAIALMTAMVGLKLLEIHTRRDLYIVVFIGYFLLASIFLYYQEIWMVGYVLILVTALTGVLLENSRHLPGGGPGRSMFSSLLLLLQALPIMLVLFIFFPRLSGPIWSLHSDKATAHSGLGDSITLGSIANLVLSRDVAFRAEFQGAVPSPPQRYWRGPVLWDTDGRSWMHGTKVAVKAPELIGGQAETRYTVTLEPTGNRWLMLLDLPYSAPPNSKILGDFQVMLNKKVNERIRYSASSKLRYNTGPISPEEHTRGLQLPDNITQRMRDLVQSWRKSSADNRAIVEHALGYFRNEEFYYTLRPPLLGSNPVDQFIFESRRGFCEHYASSFTLLMRLAGIPSRIVTGYQGGEYNPLGDHLIVRQSDAHAWSEVWLKGAGWVRIDPTAAVAPERIERSFQFDSDHAYDLLGTPIRFGTVQSGLLAQALRQLRWGVDAINATWHRWVLGYTNERQARLMRILGLDFLKGRRLAFAMVGSAAIVVVLLGISLWHKGSKKVDPIYADYLRFCSRLKRRGMVRRPCEGPLDYLARICTWRPEIATAATEITQIYIELRYGKNRTKSGRRSLHRLTGRFRP